MNKGKLVISGDRAEIFHYGKDSLIKLFRKEISTRHVEREANNTRMASECGIPVPAIIDVIQLDGRDGIVMEYIKGPTITNILRRSPHKINVYAQILAQLHADLHKVSVTGFQNQRIHMESSIQSTSGRLGENTSQTILEMLKNLPDGDKICHNDLHQENIIFSENGPVIIDWQEALCGNPIADVVQAILIQEHPVPAPILKTSTHYFHLHNKYRKLFAKLYLKEYMKLTNTMHDEVQAWLLPVAGTRLFTKTSAEEKDWTENFIRKQMSIPTN